MLARGVAASNMRATTGTVTPDVTDRLGTAGAAAGAASPSVRRVAASAMPVAKVCAW